VKTAVINNGSQIIAICSDITKLKEMEAQAQKMRALFFSSVAHELRTPLNSIIPIIRMMLDTMELEPRVVNYLQIILNSALHLQNVIEDALDMSRLENNKFSIFKEIFDLRLAVQEVCDIMRFQIKQKGLDLNLQIGEGVPSTIHSD
jgi:signal transduction histidine kinase